MKKYKFIFKGKLIDVYAESFQEAEIIAQGIFEELNKLKEKEENEEEALN